LQLGKGCVAYNGEARMQQGRERRMNSAAGAGSPS